MQGAHTCCTYIKPMCWTMPRVFDTQAHLQKADGLCSSVQLRKIGCNSRRARNITAETEVKETTRLCVHTRPGPLGALL